MLTLCAIMVNWLSASRDGFCPFKEGGLPMKDLVIDDLRLLTSEAGLRIAEHLGVAGEKRDEVAAQVIIQQLPVVLSAYGEMGFETGPVMYLAGDDYEIEDPTLGEEFCSPDWLKGRALLVYSHCLAVGLAPSIVFIRNIERNRTRFAIVADWDPTPSA